MPRHTKYTKRKPLPRPRVGPHALNRSSINAIASQVAKTPQSITLNRKSVDAVAQKVATLIKPAIAKKTVKAQVAYRNMLNGRPVRKTSGRKTRGRRTRGSKPAVPKKSVRVRAKGYEIINGRSRRSRGSKGKRRSNTM